MPGGTRLEAQFGLTFRKFAGSVLDICRQPSGLSCEALPECQILSLAASEDSRANQAP
jgi:hypothetical protein